jgi:hypothetical protein
MTGKKKKKKVVIIFFLLLAFLILSNSLRRPNFLIRLDLLWVFPKGMHMEEVIRISERRNGWRITSIRENSGVLMFGREPRHAPHANYTGDLLRGRIIGEQTISLHLGYYRTIFITDVVAYLAFDEDGYLIEIAIARITDSL